MPNDKLAATMLSLIGALKHDTDEQHTRKFIIDFVLTYLNSVDILDHFVWDVWEVRKPSLLLGQILRTNGYHDLFDYRVLRETGANAILPSYLIGIYVNKKLLGFGRLSFSAVRFPEFDHTISKRKPPPID